MSGLRSPAVVISWWSNCLGLLCLQRLTTTTEDRDLYVVQVGKSAAQKQLFREQLPAGVKELPYAEDAPGEHSRVLSDIVLRQLNMEAGLWFFDHDVFLSESCESWFRAADDWLHDTDYCLCLGTPIHGPAITQPALWISPARWPVGMANFDPIPYEPQAVSRRPDLYPHDGKLKMPIKDTLVAAREQLAGTDQVAYYPLTAEAAEGQPLQCFPRHEHLGGLYLFSGPVLSPRFAGWMQEVVSRFTDFYAHYPADVMALEDPELLRRFHEFQAKVGTATVALR